MPLNYRSIDSYFYGRRALPAIKILIDTIYFLKILKTFFEKVFKALPALSLK